MKKKIRVLLYGPELNKKNAFYGEGVGGYTRSMSIFLKYFSSEYFELRPSYYSIRSNIKYPALMFPIRFIRDLFFFLRDIFVINPRIVHILGQYRKALPREFFIVFISRIFRKKVVYEIIAGSFIKAYNSGNIFYKKMIRYILLKSDVILAEGEIYIPFINKITQKETCFYLPNFVPADEVPQNNDRKLNGNLLKVLFVGYCYEGKGIFELLEGLNLSAKNGININLTLIGGESSEFKHFMSSFISDANLNISRRGVQSREVILREMKLNDIYLYPSKHPGEGHTNSINEAMMNNMVIITTRVGFLASVLHNCAYFLDNVTAEEIANKINLISANHSSAIEMGVAARKKFLENYTSEIQIPRLESFYKFAIVKDQEDRLNRFELSKNSA